MSSRILLEENKLRQGLYQPQEDFAPQSNGVGWPKNTWFQKRLRYVREQQLKKGTEADMVYECTLGTIKLRQSNGGD